MGNIAAPEIERELRPGERLVWSGQPRRGIQLRASDVFIIPFSILWCGFVVVWEAVALVIAVAAIAQGGAPIGVFMLSIGGLPFVVIGLYLLLGRFIVDARARKRTYYGISTERIIIVFRRRTQSLNLRALTNISLTERSDGSGTIIFGQTHRYGPWLAPRSRQYALPAFDMIERVKEVYDIIRQQQPATCLEAEKEERQFD